MNVVLKSLWAPATLLLNERKCKERNWELKAQEICFFIQKHLEPFCIYLSYNTCLL